MIKKNKHLLNFGLPCGHAGAGAASIPGGRPANRARKVFQQRVVADQLFLSGMVSRREVRHLGALGTAGRAARRRLVCAQHVSSGQARNTKAISKNYGHPSTNGYKDIIPLWKAEKWDPDALMALYVKAGAKYFVSMGVHHDNFDLWNSKFHSWNAVKMGPHRDIRR